MAYIKKIRNLFITSTANDYSAVVTVTESTHAQN